MPARKKLPAIDLNGLQELAEQSPLMQCAADKHSFLFMLRHVLRDYYDPKKIDDVIEFLDINWNPSYRREKKMYRHFMSLIRSVTVGYDVNP